MALLASTEPPPPLPRGGTAARGMTLLVAVALTLALNSPGMAVGTGDITQLSGSSGLDGCVSKDGTEGGTQTTDVVCETEPLLSNPTVVTVSPDNKHVYVGQAAGGKVLVFVRNKSTKGGASFGSLDVPAGSTTVSGVHRDILVTPDNKHVYITAGANLFMFSRNAKTGALTALTPAKIQNLPTPEGLATPKDGKHVYLAARGLKGVIVFARNKKTGLLTESSCVAVDPAPSDGCTPGVGMKGATDVAVSNDGKSVYVTADVSNAVAMFTRDKKTGELTQAPSPDGCWSQTGQDGSTGPTDVCRDGRGLLGANGIAIPTDGKFVYVSSTDSNAIALFSRDTKTGDLTQFPDTEGCVSEAGNDGNAQAGVGQCTAADIGGLIKVQKVVISDNGNNLYTSARGNTTASHKGAISAFTRDEELGTLTQLSCTGPDAACASAGVALHQLQGLAVAKDGKNVYVTAPGDDAVAAFEVDK